MKKEKGFTLVEILAVIIIIGLVALISIPPIMRNIQESRTAARNQMFTNIEEFTQLYIRENKDNIAGINEINTVIEIPLQDLVDAGKLEAPIIDPSNDREISLETTVTVTVLPRSNYQVTLDEADIIYAE